MYEESMKDPSMKTKLDFILTILEILRATLGFELRHI